jgi:hypothetical protein
MLDRRNKMKTALGLGLLLASVIGCSTVQKAQLQTSEKILAAQGELKTQRTDNDNTKIDLSVKHLAQPTKISPDANTFVVWVRPEAGAPAQNIGALNVDKNLTGKLQSVTPLKDFDLFVTAENSPVAESPSGESLLWSTVTRKK